MTNTVHDHTYLPASISNPITEEMLPQSNPLPKRRTPRHTPSNYRTQFGQFKITTIQETPTVAMISPSLTHDYWKSHIVTSDIFDPQKEHLVIFTLNARFKLTGWNLVSIGTLNESAAHPREILRPVIVASAYAFILAHNHPSGDSSPSDADRRMTEKIRNVAKMAEIHLLDHVIIGDPSFYSFKQSGLV